MYNYKYIVVSNAHAYHSYYYRRHNVKILNKGNVSNQGLEGHVRKYNLGYDSPNPCRHYQPYSCG